MKKLPKKEIIAWLNNYSIENYTLVVDQEYGFIVDVADDVAISLKGLKTIPVKFNIVSGNFNCGSNHLTSLEGSPVSVGGSFLCGGNRLTSLKGCPISVGNSVDCSHNELESLNYSPTSVMGYFACCNNHLTNLEGCPSSVNGNFYCEDNQLTSLEHCPTSVGGMFCCENNPLPSAYQQMTDFTELKNIVISDREKSLLSESLATCQKNTPNKL